MLSFRQSMSMVLIGIALWALCLLVARLVPVLLEDSLACGLLFAVTPVGAGLLILGARRMAGLRRDQIVVAAAWVAAIAMVLDGLVLRWLPGAYGGEDEVTRMAGAWLLWGYGVTFAIALWMGRDLPAERAGERS